MRMNRVFALGASMLVVLAACSSGGGASASAAAKADIKIGSDGFYESKLAAEMWAQVLEANGYKVTRNLGLGPREARAPAFETGQVDLVPEYVGSGLGYYDKTKTTSDGEQNKAALQTILNTKGTGGAALATVFAISPGQDSNAFVVRKDTADSLKLVKMSDLKAVQDQLKWGLPSECDKNNLCKGALEQYGITYPPKQREALGACDAPMAEALKGKAIDVAELCSTQPAIAQFGFVQLIDDLKTQPAENMAALVRNDYLAKVDKTSFQALIDGVTAKLTTDELTKLGVEVAVNNKDVADVAKAWLVAQGLLKQ